MFAVSIIKKGAVGPSGRTSAMLDRNLARARDMIDRSLTQARLRSEVAAHPEHLALARVIEEIEMSAMSDADARGLALDTSCEPGLELYADRQMIISAIANLVQNAIKFSRQGGQVALRASTVGDHIAVEVEDECGGLPRGRAEELSHPEPFRTTDPKGSGLGVAIVHQAARLHRGGLEVTNLPGKGCIFAIKLPRTGAMKS
jgi:signal transduction histidine kinase